MTMSSRLEVISALCTSLASTSVAAGCDVRSTQLLTKEAVYALPAKLLDSVEKLMPDWLSAAELRQEREFSRLCARYHAADRSAILAALSTRSTEARSP